MDCYVIKNVVGEKWSNIIKIQSEDDWKILNVWLKDKQIEELKKNGTLQDEEFLYSKIYEGDTKEYLTNFSFKN